VTNSDVVDVLLQQHDQMRRLCADVARAGGADQRRLFAELERQVNVHERSEGRITHAATRGATPAGDAIGRARMTEEREIEWAIGELHTIGAGDATFGDRFAELRNALTEHMSREESDEFPYLRQFLSPAKLHRMAAEMHDLQVMSAG
jgi:Hemerythrin HHE cation binding domain